MAGRMGGEQVTVKGLKIVVIDAEAGLLAVSGAVPGPRRGLIMVKGL
jgi:large subunit ribosomal protein L3